jgi:ElaA protein
MDDPAMDAPVMNGAVLRRATPEELDPATLYALLRLRMEVFVVEQACPYPELDGRDLDPSTVHLWLAKDGAILGYLRLLSNGDLRRIGRVCTARQARGTGVAATLMRAALDEIGDATCVLDAQTHLTGFYAGFGFVVDGEEFVEDGIVHVPMRR